MNPASPSNQRSRGIYILMLWAILAALPNWAHAQAKLPGNYPSRVVTIIVPYPAGSAGDIETRLYIPTLKESLGQSFMVDYKPGAGTRIGMGYVAKAAPDGYTLLQINATFLMIPLTNRDFPHHPMTDFAPISMTTESQGVVVVSNNLPVKSISELIAYAKANPGKVNHGTNGLGGASHIAGSQIYGPSGAKVTYVSYKGTQEIMTDLAGGTTHVSVTGPLSTTALIKAGKVRLIAMTTEERVSNFPGVPTVKETVPGFVHSQWAGFVAPAGTPNAIVGALSKAFVKAAQTPDIAAKLSATSRIPMGTTPEEFRKRMAEDFERLKVIVKDIELPT